MRKVGSHTSLLNRITRRVLKIVDSHVISYTLNQSARGRESNKNVFNRLQMFPSVGEILESSSFSVYLHTGVTG
jgi:hypothetical protein